MTPRLRAEGPATMRLPARLGDSPRYAGSVHEDETARRLGYRGALVPGAFLFGYMSRLAVETWGEAWLCRGTMEAHSRRPVFDGDALLVRAEPLRREEDGLRAAMVVQDEAGHTVATGAATMPDTVPAPPPAPGPVRSLPDPRPAVAPGGLRPGTPFGSASGAVTAAEHRRSIADFGEEWPGYAMNGVIHPGMLLRLTMRDSIASFACPTTGIHVRAWTQFFGLAHAGERVDTCGGVVAAYERNGHHYYDSEQLVSADGRPVALVRRSAIYAARSNGEGKGP